MHKLKKILYTALITITLSLCDSVIAENRTVIFDYLTGSVVSTGSNGLPLAFSSSIATNLSVDAIRPIVNSSSGVVFQTANGSTNILGIDTVNLRVGIGTNAPQTKLHIEGGGLRQSAENISFSETANDNIGMDSVTYPIYGQTNSVWMGYGALYLSPGSRNSAVGYGSLREASGSYNAAVGMWSLLYAPGSYNTVIGYGAGRNTPGVSNVFVGAESAFVSTAVTNYYTNAIAIGAGAVPLGNNSTIIGNSAITKTEIKGNVGIGTNAPQAKLHVAGAIISATNYLYYVNASNNSGFWTDANHQHLFKCLNGAYTIVTTDIGAVPYLLFDIAANTTNTPPSIVASSLDNASVTWTAPNGTTLNTKSNTIYQFYTNSGRYTMDVSDISKVTELHFDQPSTAVSAYITNINWSQLSNAPITRIHAAYLTNLQSISALPTTLTVMDDAFRSTKLSYIPDYSQCTGMLSMAYYMRDSNPTGAIPTWLNLRNVTNVSRMFQNCANITSSIPDWSACSNITSMDVTFYPTKITGSIPEWGHMTRMVSLLDTFNTCTMLKGPLPALSNFPSLTTIANLAASCTALTGSIPTLVYNTNLTSTFNSFSSCPNLSGPFPSLSSCRKLNNTYRMFFESYNLTGTVDSVFGDYTMMTNITTTRSMFSGCYGLTGVGSNLVNCAKHPSYTVGTNSTDSSYRTFYNCTNLSDYATIPAEYK